MRQGTAPQPETLALPLRGDAQGILPPGKIGPRGPVARGVGPHPECLAEVQAGAVHRGFISAHPQDWPLEHPRRSCRQDIPGALRGVDRPRLLFFYQQASWRVRP